MTDSEDSILSFTTTENNQSDTSFNNNTPNDPGHGTGATTKTNKQNKQKTSYIMKKETTNTIKQSCGLDIMRCSFDVNKDLKEIWQESFEYLISGTCCKTFRNNNPEKSFSDLDRNVQLCGQTEIDLHLDICQWNNQVVHKLVFPDTELSAHTKEHTKIHENPLINLEHEDIEISSKLENDFLSQIQHAQYTQTPAILVDCPIPSHKQASFPANLARLIYRAINTGMPNIWLELPLVDDNSNEVLVNFEKLKKEQLHIESGWQSTIPNRKHKDHLVWKSKITKAGYSGKAADVSNETMKKKLGESTSCIHPTVINEKVLEMEGKIIEDLENDRLYKADTWKLWNGFRFINDMHSRLGLVLRVGAQIPRNLEIERWLGEPVKGLRGVGYVRRTPSRALRT